MQNLLDHPQVILTMALLLLLILAGIVIAILVVKKLLGAQRSPGTRHDGSAT